VILKDLTKSNKYTVNINVIDKAADTSEVIQNSSSNGTFKNDLKTKVVKLNKDLGLKITEI
jgi:hypothetical protein